MTPVKRLTLPEQTASQAELIVNSLQETIYQHHEVIDVDRGQYDCDCSGFVGFVLNRSAPAHYAMIPKEADQPRPRAFEFHDFLQSLTPQSTGGWHRIDFLQDVVRGDIVAWRFLRIVPHKDTGHVLIAAQAPTRNADGTFSLRIYDSAALSHFDDTRLNGVTGVGSGTIHFQVDQAGRPIAVQFTPNETFLSHSIVIGRLEPLPPG